jgi:hypothetical protein
MARRIAAPEPKDAPEPEDDAAGEPVVTGPHFAGLDPRVAVLIHPADWPLPARRRHAAAIRAGLAAGWWSGMRPRSGRDWLDGVFDSEGAP